MVENSVCNRQNRRHPRPPKAVAHEDTAAHSWVGCRYNGVRTHVVLDNQLGQEVRFVMTEQGTVLRSLAWEVKELKGTTGQPPTQWPHHGFASGAANFRREF